MTIDLEKLSIDEMREDIVEWSWIVNDQRLQAALGNRVLGPLQDFAQQNIDAIREEFLKRRNALEVTDGSR